MNSSEKSYKNNENKVLLEIKKKIADAYAQGKLNDGNYLKDLDYIKAQITNAYAAGKLNELQYGILDKKLSTCYRERFIKTIDSLNGKVDLDAIKNDITSAHAEGKINELHYNLLNEKISAHEKRQASIDEKLSSSHDNKYDIRTSQGSPIKTNKR